MRIYPHMTVNAIMQLHTALSAERIIIFAILPRAELLLVARTPPSVFLPRCTPLATPAGRLETLERRFAFLPSFSRENRNAATIFRRRFSQCVIARGETSLLEKLGTFVRN